MTASRTICGIVALALGTSAALAHDTWLDVAHRGPEGVELALTSGMAFPDPDHAIDAERVARAELRTAGRRETVAVGARGERALALRATLEAGEAGIATVELHPRTLELSGEQVLEYLAEIGAGPEVRAAWEEKRRWRERYRKVAKVVLRDGAALLDDALLGSTGRAFELSLRRDPLARPAGERIEICAFAGGAPVPSQLLRVHGGATNASARTGEDGCAALDATAPKVLISAVRLRPASEPDLDWESDFATLVVETTGARSP